MTLAAYQSMVDRAASVQDLSVISHKARLDHDLTDLQYEQVYWMIERKIEDMEV